MFKIIKKINIFEIIKKKIKWIFCLIILFIILFFSFLEKKIIKLHENKIPFLETKVQILKEWEIIDAAEKKQKMIEIHYTFNGLNGIGYYQKQLENNEKKISELKNQLKQEINNKNNAVKIIELKNKIEDIGLETYGKSFFEKIENKYLNEEKISFLGEEEINLTSRIKLLSEPTDLASYIKKGYPFNLWNKYGDNYNYLTLNGFESATFEKENDSDLWFYIKIEKQKNKFTGENYLILKYEGPKHLIEEEQDYYLGKAFIHNSQFKLKYFNLYFNPNRKILSIFKEKNNNKAQKR